MWLYCIYINFLSCKTVLLVLLQFQTRLHPELLFEQFPPLSILCQPMSVSLMLAIDLRSLIMIITFPSNPPPITLLLKH